MHTKHFLFYFFLIGWIISPFKMGDVWAQGDFGSRGKLPPIFFTQPISRGRLEARESKQGFKLQYLSLQMELPWERVKERKEKNGIIQVIFSEGQSILLSKGALNMEIVAPKHIKLYAKVLGQEIVKTNYNFYTYLWNLVPPKGVVTPEQFKSVLKNAEKSTLRERIDLILLTLKAKISMAKDDDRIFEFSNDHGIKGFEYSGAQKGSYMIQFFDAQDNPYDLILGGFDRSEVDFMLSSIRSRP